MRTVSLIPLFLFWEASKETGLAFLARGFKGNSVPLTRGVQRGSSPPAGRIQRNLGFVAGVSKGGRAPLGTRSCLQGLVCYTFCGRGRRRGLATGQRKGLSATPGQAGFAGLLAENARLVRSKARLADKGCVRLDGAKRKKSVRSRAAGGI